MKKMKAFVAVLFILMLMAGCSKSFDADTNTVYVKEDGSVMHAIIEDFSESNYDSSELEKMVNESISEYNDGSENVKVEKYKVKNEIAKLIMSYQSSSDYANYNKVDFFVGTISEAKNAGYDFEQKFTSIEDQNTVGAETIKSLTQYKVVIFDEDVQLKTDSKILYISSNTSLVDAKTAKLNDGAEGLAYIIYE